MLGGFHGNKENNRWAFQKLKGTAFLRTVYLFRTCNSQRNSQHRRNGEGWHKIPKFEEIECLKSHQNSQWRRIGRGKLGVEIRSRPKIAIANFRNKNFHATTVVPFQVWQKSYKFLKCQNFRKLRFLLAENFENYCLKLKFVY
jgi:hypothetical protein